MRTWVTAGPLPEARAPSGEEVVGHGPAGLHGTRPGGVVRVREHARGLARAEAGPDGSDAPCGGVARDDACAPPARGSGRSTPSGQGASACGGGRTRLALPAAIFPRRTAVAQQLRDIMTRQVHTVHTDASLLTVARIMRDQRIGDVLVTEDDGSLCGIITDRDSSCGRGGREDAARSDPARRRHLLERPDPDRRERERRGVPLALRASTPSAASWWSMATGRSASCRSGSSRGARTRARRSPRSALRVPNN